MNAEHPEKPQSVKECLSFNLAYFDGTQKAGQKIEEWSEADKNDLLHKVKSYCNENKVYWLNQRCGAGGNTILEIYGNFPRNTDFVKPANVPDHVRWARFRMEGAKRLVGFFWEDEFARQHELSTQVFHVVFLDANHKFYKMEKK